MTNAEVLESQNLIADMRADLALVAGTTDIEKLVALIVEKGPGMGSKTKEDLSGCS
jgi:hypothetical protein